MDTCNQHAGSGLLNSRSIIGLLDRVMLQVRYDYFADVRSKRIDPLYKELCLIIAEVLILDHDSVIKINGNAISVLAVQEVYSQIRNHHVQLVFDNFHNVTHRVLNKKAYLRTALYNAAFECEANVVNELLQG